MSIGVQALLTQTICCARDGLQSDAFCFKFLTFETPPVISILFTSERYPANISRPNAARRKTPCLCREFENLRSYSH